MKTNSAILALLALVVLTGPLAYGADDQPPGPVGKEHALLQNWETGQGAWTIPVSNISWTHDTAAWFLESGTVRFMRPMSDGTVTGFVFEGQGRFRMSIPNTFEVEQLRRFSGKEEIKGVDVSFSSLVWRSSDELPSGLAPPAELGVFAADEVMKDRHKKLLRDWRRDADAMVIETHINNSEDYLMADMDTESFGWLMYECDPRRQEEIQLIKVHKIDNYPEVWVSLDARDERDKTGRPTSGPNDAIDISHVDLEIDLREHSGSVQRTNRPVHRDWASFTAKVEFTALENRLLALRLGLHPFAQLRSVTDADGRQLEFLRDHIGDRFASIDHEYSDSATTVILNSALNSGDSSTLIFEYDIEIYNYISGRSWYPSQLESVSSDLHTAELKFNLPPKFEVRCVGEEVENSSTADGVVSVWRVTKPTMMVGFSFGKGFKEEHIQVEGVPEVIAFGDPKGLFGGNIVRNVAADIVNSLKFYQWFYDIEIPTEHIYATGITGSHGQAFDGFIHLSHYTFESEHPGATELFRAHEVAH